MLRFLTVAVLLLALAACDGATSRADVTGLRLQREGEAYPTLTGYLVNEGDRPITSADVFVTLYDGDNRPLDDVIVQVRNVAAGDSARFEQRLDLQANGAKLKYIGAN
ncbi:MAG: FxLYD domain-containing protein [Bacteroidota bacterium]